MRTRHDCHLLRWPGLRTFALAVLAAGAIHFAAAAQAAIFTVNSPSDVHDANPGDGVCETAAGNHVCTFRAAIDEANKLAGADTIILQANVTYLLTLTSTVNFTTADIVITDSVTITGPGASGTIIDGNGGTTGQRVFAIFKCINDARNNDNVTCTIGGVVATMSGITIEHGFSGNIAGGIFNVGTLNLENCIVTDNTANGLNDWGGGIYNAGPLTINSSVISNNTAGSHNSYGGGIYNQSDMTIVNSTISGNNISGSPGEGGGIFNISASSTGTTIRQSTISGNHATLGGGIYKAGYPLVLVSSTISGNFSTGSGGGLYAASGTTGLYNVTVSQNQANSDASGTAVGGGVANASGSTLNIADSIISANELVIATLPFPTLDVDECSGTITSLGNNILTYIKAEHCTITGPYTVADPLLGPLQFNGGLTQTHALLSGSPAIDAGNIGGCTDALGAPVTSDQRGVHRPYGTYCDIGAFEAAEVIFKNGFEP